MSGQDEYEFQPRLGRSKRSSGARPRTMKQFLKGARAQPAKRASSGTSSRPAFGARRVYVQARVQRLSGCGLFAQRAHVSYLERDGAGRGEERAEFYNENTEGLDGQQWIREHADERHHFRFIVSPENGEKLQDLKPFIRDLVGQMEIDLVTKLDWIAVDHHNTEHPHTHIVVSGKRDDGRDLVIPRDYLSHNMRERGSALLTRELGLQSEAELSAKLERETAQRKMTRMDRVLLRRMEREGAVDLACVRRNREHYQARLRALRQMGFAEHQGGTRWTIEESLGVELAALEKSDTVARRIERAIKAAGLDRISAPHASAYDPALSVQGRLLTIDYADELVGSRYGIVDGLNGRVHHVEFGTQRAEGVSTGDMIEVKPRASGALRIDRDISEISAQSDGFYSREAHRTYEPAVSQSYLDMCERRLEALEKQGLVSPAMGDARAISRGFLGKVNEHYERLAKRSPSIVRKLDYRDFENQISARGETWLDQQLAGTAPEPLSEAGLGGEVRTAMAERLKMLQARGIVQDRASALTPAQIGELQRDGMTDAAKQIAKATGLTYFPFKPSGELQGAFERTHQTATAKYAVIEHGHQFALVPWSRELERLRHQQIQVVMSPGMELNWTRGRSRGLGISR